MHKDGSSTIYDEIDNIRTLPTSLVLNAENDVSFPGQITCGDEDFMEYVYFIEGEPHYGVGVSWDEDRCREERKKIWGDKEMYYYAVIGQRKGKHFQAVFNNICYLCNDNGKTMQRIGY